MLRSGLDAAGWTLVGISEKPATPVPFGVVVPRLSPSATALTNWARRSGLAPDYRVVPRLERMQIVIGPQK
jgi:hypothetical protein